MSTSARKNPVLTGNNHDNRILCKVPIREGIDEVYIKTGYPGYQRLDAVLTGSESHELRFYDGAKKN